VSTTDDRKEIPLTREVLDKFAQLITTTLGLLAALAWNTAIQNLFDRASARQGPGWPARFSTPPS
jgi:hypothetical protein